MRCVYVDRKGRQCVRYGSHLLHAYARLSKTGKRVQRERADLDNARAAVKARSRGICEAAFERINEREGSEDAHFVCGTWKTHQGAHAHHVWIADRDRGVHDQDRMLWLCDASHAYAHAHPARARELRLLLKDGDR